MLMLAAGIAWALPAGAAIRAYDGFAYTPGSELDGQDGGAGFDGPWSEPPVPVDGSNRNPPADVITSGSLAFGPLLTTGHRAVTGGEFSFDARDLSLAPANRLLYASFLLRRDSNGNGGEYGVGDYGGLEIDGSNASVLLGDSAENELHSIEIAGVGFPVASRSPVTTGDTAFLVARIAFDAGGGDADDIRLYVNPAPGRPEPAAASAARADLDLGALTGIGISTGTNATWSVDEIRVGDTYADVTPASFAPLPGDANLDGAVDHRDFAVLRQGFGRGSTWVEGDFDGDGVVSFADFQQMEIHFGGVVSAGVPATDVHGAVPEPVGFAAVAVVLLSARRSKGGRRNCEG